ncbi:WD40 repeat domain-containing protein [Streptomyces sp. 1114.5]|uniref:WD40 repeat domain-containing protein n=1 Tax=Streptomyces sp. 1114.5 TaxID=1938830 RepID=UPI0011C45EAA|nr:WD40 repeat domain-containing protein [Streptomyces sp. 1114.5]
MFEEVALNCAELNDRHVVTGGKSWRAGGSGPQGWESMSGRQALVVAVGSFAAAVEAGRELPVGTEPWGPLSFVYGLVPEVRQSIERLGYGVVERVDPDLRGLREGIQTALDDGYRIIHVMSHGDTGIDGDPTRVDVVPSCATTGRLGTNVSEWVSVAQVSGRHTLFLLDLCHSGRAARLPYLLQRAGRDTYAWVIAASDSSEAAYDGRFSEAVAQVFDELAQNRFDAHPAQRYVSFSVVARRIGELVAARSGLRQTVSATPLDATLSEPELPFFPNPRFVEDRVMAERRRIDPPIRAFLDELDPRDAGHFADKAGRRFTGRRSQLRLLVRWMAEPDTGRICVVTGGPGTGKSALLGALVCAAHPRLVGEAQHILDRLDPECRPSVDSGLVAVQARQRSLGDLISALAGQLHLPGPATGWTAAAFVEAVAALSEPPTVVVDAVDEAIDPGALTADLLLPLADSRRADGRHECRLVVGLRPWEQFAALRHLAEYAGVLVDLDTVDIGELRTDLTVYLADLLAEADDYSGTARAVVRARLARAVAGRLTDRGTGSSDWGAFLVAGVFGRYLAGTAPAKGPDDADRIGATVPTTLPEVLELDLRSRPDGPAVRALLAAFAHAKGDGMPAELAYGLAAAIHPASEPDGYPALLDGALFYLRISMDTDGTTLYRPFHQGLADYLCRQPFAASSAAGPRHSGLPAVGLVLRTLVPDRRPGPSSGTGSWSTAVPYLLRHASQHAQDAAGLDGLLDDADFLVHADPETLAPALVQAEAGPSALTVAIYRASSGIHRRSDAVTRRQLLAVDAARYGAVDLLRRLNDPLPTWAWRPRWASGSQVSNALRETLPAPARVLVTRVACTMLDGRPVAVSGGYRWLGFWDLKVGRLMGGLPAGHLDRVSGVAWSSVDGRPVAVTCGHDGTVRVWDATDQRELRCLFDSGAGELCALVCTELDGLPVAVTAGTDGALRLWDLAASEPLGDPLVGHSGRVSALRVTVLDGRPVVVSGGDDGTVRLWDLGSRAQIGDPLGSVDGQVWAVDCVLLDGGPVAVISGSEPVLRLWDLTTGRQLDDPITDLGDIVYAVGCTTLAGRPVAVTGGKDGAVRLWDLRGRRELASPLTGHSGLVWDADITCLDGQPAAVSVGWDDTIRVWDLSDHRRLGSPVAGHTEQVTSVACTVLSDVRVAVTGGYDGALFVWDLDGGRRLGEPIRQAAGASVRDLACTVVAGRPVVVAVDGGPDGAVRGWDLETRRGLGGPFAFDIARVVCTHVRGNPVAVTAGRDGAVRVWDLTTLEQTGDPLVGHIEDVWALDCAVDAGRPIVVTAGMDGTVRLWDLDSRRQVGDPLVGPVGEVPAKVYAVACAVLNGRPVAVTGEIGGTVRLWDLVTRRQVGGPLVGHTGRVYSATFAVVDGRPCAVTTADDGTVRLWEFGRLTSEVLSFPSEVHAVAASDDGELVVGSGAEVIVMDRGSASG